MTLRGKIAIKLSKFVAKLCLKMGRQGVTWAGLIARKIEPNILKILSDQIREKVYIVCGTNGKTTTNNMLCTTLQSQGKKVICNRTGSNMLNGVVSAFVLATDDDCTLNADYACIEIDEVSTKRVLPTLKPDYMVLTNIFRDQLDRYGEIDITLKILDEAIKMAPNMTLVINGDDPLSHSLAIKSGNKFITYGISEKVFDADENAEIREGRFCAMCGAKMHYNYYHYSQLGDYVCPECGFKRPKIDYPSTEIHHGDHLEFTVEGNHIKARYKGFYNIYNILAVYAVASHSGVDMKGFQSMLDHFNPENGRIEHFKIKGTDVELNLAKNPAGFNQNINAVMADPKDKDVIILINDRDQDGNDVSWLWDVDFDRFKDESIKSITVSGIRCQDMRLRLKYVDIPSHLEGNIETAIRNKIADGVGNLYVLVNYTGLYSTRNILKRMEGEK
ncbi:MAG: MurT ligase domain-containing protein [Ruminococcus sp.]